MKNIVKAMDEWNWRRLVRSNKNLCVSTTAFIFECMLMIIIYTVLVLVECLWLLLLTIIERPIEKERKTHIQKKFSVMNIS